MSASTVFVMAGASPNNRADITLLNRFTIMSLLPETLENNNYIFINLHMFNPNIIQYI